MTGRARVVVDDNGAHFDRVTIQADNARVYRPASNERGTVREAIIDWRPHFFYSCRMPARADGGFWFAVLRRTAGDVQGSLTRLGGPHTTGVSAHYLVDLDGFAVKLSEAVVPWPREQRGRGVGRMPHGTKLARLRREAACAAHPIEDLMQ